MSTATKKTSHQRSIFDTMIVIGSHILRRHVTWRFVVGFLFGIAVTKLVSHRISPNDQFMFRADQSKFEYEKNVEISNNLQQESSPLWNATWDGMSKRSLAARHLYLIRHGQYFDNARSLNAMKLTELGREQLLYTGQRLNKLNVTFKHLIHSGMVRAVESAKIINEQLDTKLLIVEDPILTEGLPVAPVPFAGISQKFVDDNGDRQRIDQAFARYFHRSSPEQTGDTHEIIVFHANVLRYFICKVMQFPIQAWLRITLNHGSITKITILADGNVLMNTIGDSGFIPASKVTF